MSTTDADGPLTFAFLLVPGFSMMSLASAVEPLRSLNRLIFREDFRWIFASLDGDPVQASNCVSFPAVAYGPAIEAADYLFVCGGLRIKEAGERRYLSILRQAARRRIGIGSLSTGTYLLARAGLLEGYRCTIHWENRSAFQEDFPDLDCTNKIYEIDRDRLTCSGGTAAMDMMLHLITDRHGADLARAVANQFHHERIRNEDEDQRGGRTQTLAFLPAPVRQAIAAMRAAIENPAALPDIAASAGVSTRQLERLFLRHTGVTPLRYYLQIRLDRARELLLYSDRSVIEIAVSSGFTSTSHLSTWYRRIHGVRPSDMRHEAGAPRMPARSGRNS